MVKAGKGYKRYDDLTFVDDFMFCKVLENNEDICKELIELILDVEIEIVHEIGRQKAIEITDDGKGIRLDVYMRGDDTVYELEMQTSHKEELPKRSRYYQGLTDLDMMERGAKYTELKDTVLIFICTFDPLGYGRSQYSIIQTVDEDRHIEYNDGTKKVFLSTLPEQEGTMSPALRAFLDYMNDNVPSSDLSIRVDEAVRRIKSHQKWRKEYMLLEEKYSEFLMEGREEGREEGRQEGRQEGLAEGRIEGQAELIRKMHQNGMSVNDIITFTQMSEEKVQEILKPLPQ